MISQKKRREFEEQCHLKPKYAGDDSASFWSEVNASKNEALYILACVLQDVEGRVLREVNKGVDERVREAFRRNGVSQRKRSAR